MPYIVLLACGHWLRSWMTEEPEDGTEHTCPSHEHYPGQSPAVYLPDRPLDALRVPLGQQVIRG